MEDQFGGRTDDDLFYDDFEPVESPSVLIDETRRPESPTPKDAPQPPPVVTATVAQHKEPGTAAQTSTSSPFRSHRSLATSRWADKPATANTTTAASTSEAVNKSTPKAPSKVDATTASPSPPVNAPTSHVPSSPHPKQPKHQKQQPQQEQDTERGREQERGNQQSASASAPATALPDTPSAAATASAASRLKSGANPRQKLTDAELAAKMAQMKLLAAEKTRKFEMAEKDEKQHAQAYARGMEEARRRRAEDAERRRKGEEERRKLDDERARNRERKLKAMSTKEGGWDEGKEVLADEEARRTFRGANGGVRGSRGGLGGAGLTSSRYARDGSLDVDRFLDDRSRGRGRGRVAQSGNPTGGRSRGGAQHVQGGRSVPAKGSDAAPSLTADEFPSLPSDGKPKTHSKAISQLPPVPSLPTPPPGGKWDDEMEALDELKQGGQS